MLLELSLLLVTANSAPAVTVVQSVDLCRNVVRDCAAAQPVSARLRIGHYRHLYVAAGLENHRSERMPQGQRRSEIGPGEGSRGRSEGAQHQTKGQFLLALQWGLLDTRP